MADPLIVCKFGGTSLPDAEQFSKVRTIIERDPRRRYVVVSAPGKRHPQDRKVTDLLYLCHKHVEQDLRFGEIFGLIVARYREIADGLGLDQAVKGRLDGELEQVRRAMVDEQTPDYAASRGEYLSALLMAAYLGWPMVDAAELITFDAQGRVHLLTYSTIAERLGHTPQAVIPGFYGTGHDGRVKTFSRGGSDITGAIIAAGVAASRYENWTDVPGLLSADPQVVGNPRPIPVVTYREMRELAYSGAQVLHPGAVIPVRETGIPVHIRCTNQPDAIGTLIVPDESAPADHTAVTGIAGRQGFAVVELQKTFMNEEVGFIGKVVAAFAAHGISIEHVPSGIDNLCVVVEESKLAGKLEAVRWELQLTCQPDSLEVYPNLALVCVVGRRMRGTRGIAAQLFSALADAGVNVRMIDQGSSETSIIVGVENDDYVRAVGALYAAFFA